MSELIYKAESFQIIGLCMEVHRELGKGHDERSVVTLRNEAG